MNNVSGTVKVGGRPIELGALIDGLHKADPASEGLLARQLRDDEAAFAARPPDERAAFHSEGLRIVNLAYRGRVTAFLRGILGKDEAGIEESWVRLLERVFARISQYDASRSKLRTWIFNQARYAALDYLRESRKMSRSEGPSESVELASFVEEPLTTHESAALRRAMARLTPTQRTLVWWRYVRGLTPVEISRAGLTEIPEEQVRVYIARAMTSLRTYMEEERRR
jgi:RNA polymerase sigma factor (sigma-70 family)